MKVFRRLHCDYRINRDSQAFQLWHWYYDCKDKNGEVHGFRAEAWYIAQKFGWKPATVYAKNALLIECRYLAAKVTQGSKYVFRILWGINEVPSEQGEFPFLLPVRSDPKGIPEPSGSAPRGIPGVPLEASGCASKGTPYKMCEISVKEDLVKRAPSKILYEIDGLKKELAALRECEPSPKRVAALSGIKARISECYRELTGSEPPPDLLNTPQGRTRSDGTYNAN